MLEILKEAVNALKSLFPKIKFNHILTDNHLSELSNMDELNMEVEYLGRPFYLARQKMLAYTRAIVQAGGMYLLVLISLHFVAQIASYRMRLLLGALIWSTDVTYLYFLLCKYHPMVFKDILFEKSVAVQTKEYLLLGILVKLLWLVQSALACFRLGQAINPIPNLIELLEFGENFVSTVFALAYLPYFCKYQVHRKNCVSVPMRNIPQGIMRIIKVDGHYCNVNLHTQFWVELSCGEIYVSPLPARNNPNYEITPPPYYIRLHEIAYIALGEIRVTYNFEKRKWKHISTNEQR